MSTPSSFLKMQEVIDARPLSRLQFQAISLCMLIAVLDGFDTQVIGMLAPVMSQSLGVPVALFAPALSAGLVGMLIGAFTLGPLADRYGRKRLIVISATMFGLLSLATAFARGMEQLLVLRLLTGIGLGGALPNAISLASEYSPKRLVRTIVSTLVCGMPLGATLGGVIRGVLLPVYGWQSVFVVGGTLPLIAALLSMSFMPESPEILAQCVEKREQLNSIVRRIAPDVDLASVGARSAERPQRVPLRELFEQGRAVQSVLLWIPYFMNLVVLYFIVSWMPSVLVGAHQTVGTGIKAVTLFSIGGVLGCLTQGPLMNQFGVRRSMLCQLLVYMLLAMVLAKSADAAPLVIGVSFVLGVAVQGVQGGLNALAAEIYPARMRATGVGCAVGIGRVGSFAGPLAGGVLL